MCWLPCVMEPTATVGCKMLNQLSYEKDNTIHIVLPVCGECRVNGAEYPACIA